MEMLISFSSRTWHLPTHCQRYQKLVQWPWCYSAWLASKLTWTEAHREYMEYCQEEDERHQTQQCRWPEGCYQSILGFITPEQCHRLITFMPRRIDAVIHAKGAQPSIEWIEMNILSRSLTFLFKISFFYWSYVIFKFSETLNFGFSLSVSIIIKMSRNKDLKYFTLSVMNLYNHFTFWNEGQKYRFFSWYSLFFFWCTCILSIYK